MRSTSLSLAAMLLTLGCSSAPGSRADQRARGPATTPLDLSAARLQREKWSFSLSRLMERPVVVRCAQVDEGLLLLQDADHTVHVIDLESGVHRFVVRMPGELTYPAGVTERSITLISGDTLVSVDTEVGSRLISRPDLQLKFAVDSVGFEINGSLYAGSGAPFGLQAVDGRSGLNGWRYVTRGMVQDLKITGSGELSYLIAIARDGLIVALPAWPASGKMPTAERWFRRLRGVELDRTSSLQAGSLLVPASDGFLYCLDARNGVVRWKTGADVPYEGSPLVADHMAFAVTGGSLQALDLETGAVAWTSENTGRAISKVGEQVFALDAKGQLTVLNAATGHKLAGLGSSSHLPVVQGGGVLVMGDRAGNFIAYE